MTIICVNQFLLIMHGIIGISIVLLLAINYAMLTTKTYYQRCCLLLRMMLMDTCPCLVYLLVHANDGQAILRSGCQGLMKGRWSFNSNRNQPVQSYVQSYHLQLKRNLLSICPRFSNNLFPLLTVTVAVSRYSFLRLRCKIIRKIPIICKLKKLLSIYYFAKNKTKEILILFISQVEKHVIKLFFIEIQIL